MKKFFGLFLIVSIVFMVSCGDDPVKTFKNLTRESIVETLRILLNFILPPLLCF